MLFLNPTWQLSSREYPPCVVWKRTGKVWEVHGLGYRECLIGKAKITHISKVKRDSFMPYLGQVQVHPSPGELGSITHNGNLGRQTPAFPMFPSSFLFTQFNVIRMTIPCGLEYSFGQLGPAVPAMSSPSPWGLHPVPAGWGEEQKRPWPCTSPDQQEGYSTVLSFQYCFLDKSKNNLHASYCEEKQLYLSQRQHNN